MSSLPTPGTSRRRLLLLGGAAALAGCAAAPDPRAGAIAELASTGKLRAAINLGNPILASRGPGVSYGLARLPGAPFVVSAAAYGLAIWALSGVRPAASLVGADAGITVGADAGITVAASTETGGIDENPRPETAGSGA